MKSILTNFRIILMFTVVAVIAIAPFVVINFNNSKLINGFNASHMSDEDIRGIKANANYNTAQRIQIITQSRQSREGATSSYGIVGEAYGWVDGSDDSIEGSTQVTAIESQMKVLQELGALPKVEFINAKIISMEKVTYSTSKASNNFVSTINASLLYPNSRIEVMMDAETSMIYEITMEFIDGRTMTEDIDDSKFFDYLGIQALIVNETNAKDNSGEYKLFHTENLGFEFYFRTNNGIVDYKMLAEY